MSLSRARATRRRAWTAVHSVGLCLITRLAAKVAPKAAAASRPRGVSGRKVSNSGSNSRQKNDL